MNNRDANLRDAALLQANERLLEAREVLSKAVSMTPGDPVLLQALHNVTLEIVMIQQRELLGNITQTLNRTAHSLFQLLIRDLQSDDRYADPKRLERFGFSVGSQNEEDGMLAEVFRRIGEGTRTFFEFGVGNGLQNCTYFFLLSGWKGWWVEIEPNKVNFMRNHFAKAINEGRLVIDDTPIEAENIEQRCDYLNIPDSIDLLSIDIDGNDYHVFDAMKRVNARVVVLEYNGAFPPPMQVVGAYDRNYRYEEHTYIGASLQSITDLAETKGYQLVGCNITGLNCIFVRKDLAEGKFPYPSTPEHLYNTSRHQLAWGGAFGQGPRANYGPLHESAALKKPLK